MEQATEVFTKLYTSCLIQALRKPKSANFIHQVCKFNPLPAQLVRDVAVNAAWLPYPCGNLYDTFLCGCEMTPQKCYTYTCIS